MKARVWTAAGLMAIAAEIESRDASRYRELARLVIRRDEEAARCLEGLIADNKQRLQAIAEWAGKAGVDLVPDMSAIADLPVDPSLGDDHWGDPALLGPYLVLAKATTERTNAFRFYSYLAAEAADPAVKALAELFAQEELARAGELRIARRRAWRREGRRQLRWRDLLASLDDDTAAGVAAAILACAAAKVEDLAEGAAALPEDAEKLYEVGRFLRVSARAAPDLAANIADLVFMPLTASSSLDRARQLLERLFETLRDGRQIRTERSRDQISSEIRRHPSRIARKAWSGPEQMNFAELPAQASEFRHFFNQKEGPKWMRHSRTQSFQATVQALTVLIAPAQGTKGSSTNSTTRRSKTV